MSDPRTFVSSFVEESLGLVKGQLERYPLDKDFVEELAGILRGAEPREITRPVVEERMLELSVRLKETALKEDGFYLRKARWPDGARLGVCLTHDVDNISRPASHIWKTRSRFGALDLLGGLLGVIKLYDNVRLICGREKKYGFRSSFYFLTKNYPLYEVKEESESARRQGWDIGLHGDFGTHDSLDRMKEAVAIFSAEMGYSPEGLREHYLRFDFARSWNVMEQAGFTYDTTVGTNDKLGFRLGLASPFHPPDDRWLPMRLLEIPLVLMDTTLWGYLKRTEQEGLADIVRSIALVESVEGLFSLLWHQEAVRMRGGRIYWRLLREFKEHGCYVASGAAAAEWWLSRSSVPLVKDGKLIRFGADPPEGLVLRLDVPADRTPPRIRSAIVEGEGSTTRTLRSMHRSFELEVL